ncbi:hypothetical protein BJ165DRAFT_1481374 [Panaeolus papilionaceus]|nr:hypothetical protein BJ165DRAFT_1481374 [Panaeolus papilionaceus]
MRIVAITPTLLVVQIGLSRSRVVVTGLTGSEPTEQEEFSEVVLDTVLTSGGRTSHSEVPHPSSQSRGSSMA